MEITPLTLFEVLKAAKVDVPAAYSAQIAKFFDGKNPKDVFRMPSGGVASAGAAPAAEKKDDKAAKKDDKPKKEEKKEEPVEEVDMDMGDLFG